MGSRLAHGSAAISGMEKGVKKTCPLTNTEYTGRCGATTCMWNLSSFGCTKGIEVSANTIATGRGIEVESVRKSKDKGRLAIARILILDEYAAFVENAGYPTFLPREELEKVCTEILAREWYSTGIWNISKLVACCAKENWARYLDTLDAPDHDDDETATLAEQLSAHRQPLRRVLALSKSEFKSLSFGDYPV